MRTCFFSFQAIATLSFRAQTRNPGFVSILWNASPVDSHLRGNDTAVMYGLSPQSTRLFSFFLPFVKEKLSESDYFVVYSTSNAPEDSFDWEDFPLDWYVLCGKKNEFGSCICW